MTKVSDFLLGATPFLIVSGALSVWRMILATVTSPSEINTDQGGVIEIMFLLTGLR